MDGGGNRVQSGLGWTRKEESLFKLPNTHLRISKMKKQKNMKIFDPKSTTDIISCWSGFPAKLYRARREGEVPQ